MPRTTNRNANAPAADTTTNDAETQRRRTPASVETLAERLDSAEAEMIGRQVKYNAAKAELDRLLGPIPEREQIAQLFDRATLLNAKLRDAETAYRDALTKHNARVAEIAAEIAPDTGETVSEIEAETEAAPNGVTIAA